MQPEEYGVMFRVDETRWWYQTLHRLIFQTLETELPGWVRKGNLGRRLRNRFHFEATGERREDHRCRFSTGGSFLLLATRPEQRTSCRYLCVAVCQCVVRHSDLLQGPLPPIGKAPCCGSTNIAPRLEARTIGVALLAAARKQGAGNRNGI